MKCSLSARALRQLDEIHRYIAEHDPSAAHTLMERVQSLLLILEDQPYIGHPTRKSNVRVHALVRYPDLLFYRVNTRKNEVEVFKVMHAARRHPGFQESSEQFAR